MSVPLVFVQMHIDKTILFTGCRPVNCLARGGFEAKSRIPNAELVLLDDAGHVFSTDQPELSRQAVLSFLSRQVKAAK